MPDRPLVVAHRGLSSIFPEHTREAYEKAVPYSDAFECDVRVTRDGVLVCWHDGTLQRTSDLRGRVSSSRWEHMRHASPRPLRFEDLLDIAVEARKSLYIETKHPVRYGSRVERLLHSTLERRAKDIRDARIDINTMSFAATAVRRMRTMPSSSVQLIDKARLRIPTWHAQQVGVAYTQLTPEYIAEAHRRGQSVLAWTVNDLAAAERLTQWGVDAIITDCADQVRQLLTH